MKIMSVVFERFIMRFSSSRREHVRFFIGRSDGNVKETLYSIEKFYRAAACSAARYLFGVEKYKILAAYKSKNSLNRKKKYGKIT